MIIPSKNAFTINQLGFTGSLFPFSIQVSQKDNVSGIFVCAQRVVELCDLIEKHASNNLVIFGVEQASQFDKITKKELSIEGLAANAAIPFSAIDSKTIVLAKEYLLPLLSTFSHYSLSLFDIRNGWSESQIISQVLACREHDWRSQDAVLAKLPESQLFLDGHDDCYLTIESYSPDVSKDVFVRALQTYTGTVLAKKIKRSSKISDFPRDLINMVWQADFSLTILEKTTELKNNHLKLGVSKQPYNFREKVKYTPEFWIVYEVENQKWLVQT